MTTDVRYPMPIDPREPAPRFVATGGVEKSPLGSWVPIEYVNALAAKSESDGAVGPVLLGASPAA